jgi:hypothetical protein
MSTELRLAASEAITACDFSVYFPQFYYYVGMFSVKAECDVYFTISYEGCKGKIVIMFWLYTIIVCDQWLCVCIGRIGGRRYRRYGCNGW